MPHKSKVLQIRVAPEFLQTIKRAAAAAGFTQTELIEIAVARQIKAQSARGRRQQTAEARNTT